jgi:hypothetical protein
MKMRITLGNNGVNREKFIRCFRFLQAEDIRLVPVDQLQQQIQTQADGIDIPGDQAH